MNRETEVIAVVLDAGNGRRLSLLDYLRGAKRLVRCADGRVSLEAIESAEEFERTARTTGCFRRGKAIRDPVSRAVIGYEMEEVSISSAAIPLFGSVTAHR